MPIEPLTEKDFENTDELRRFCEFIMLLDDDQEWTLPNLLLEVKENLGYTREFQIWKHAQQFTVTSPNELEFIIESRDNRFKIFNFTRPSLNFVEPELEHTRTFGHIGKEGWWSSVEFDCRAGLKQLAGLYVEIIISSDDETWRFEDARIQPSPGKSNLSGKNKYTMAYRTVSYERSNANPN